MRLFMNRGSNEAMSAQKSKSFADGGQELSILKAAVENTNEAFVTIDETHKVVLFNRAAEEIFGYSRDEVIGKDLNAILSPECSRDHRQAVDRYLHTRAPERINHKSELTATRKNGQRFPISISFSVSEVGGHHFFTGIVVDLAETKSLQEKVARSERLAALGRIVAEITHDIKNPLLIIGAYARQVMRNLQDEKSLGKLNIITEEVKRLEGLLGQVNDYYLPRRLNLEKLDINALLRDTCALARQGKDDNKIQVNCQAEKNPAWIEGDRDKLIQVFLNLTRNAIEAMEEGGTLSIQSESASERVHIYFSDNGPGIPEKYLDQIFTPFFTTKSQGSGLGLPICKRIIEDHPGSTIALSSQEGKGTRVTITMPLRPPEPASS